MKRLLGFCLLLAGCASVPPTPVPPPVASPEITWQSRQVRLSALQSWRLSARVMVSNEEDAWQLNVIWQQQADHYEIWISGPLGMGKVRLQGSKDGVSLYDSDGRIYYAQEPDSLLLEHTGVFMPVTSLYYWIRGLPDPASGGVQVSQLDAWGRLVHLRQGDWSIDMKRYAQVDVLQLPDKLFIHNNKGVEVRMIVDKWNISQRPGAGNPIHLN
ncbi:MAG TPA: outer membrane lipoprotein LolB [Gammaproteobacteria bacterium]|nr:outer membrane lipoprotein LolB [Gammaproteobacteria bacterium]